MCRYVIISYRSVSGIRGLTRECPIALTADIVTRNYRQEFNSSHGMPPEHPRSSTTDDIECFFSVLRDVVGKDFTLKQVRAICVYTFLQAIFHCAFIMHRFGMGGERFVSSL